MEAFILSAVEQGVMTITLNRPDRLNSFNDLMHHQLAECLKQAERDDGVRCLLITGAGRGFCAGQDLNDRNVDPSGPPPDLGMSVERFYNPLVRRLAALPKPVICAVNGVAAAADWAVEMSCTLGRDGAKPTPRITHFDEKVLGLIYTIKGFEVAASQAAISGELNDVLLALNLSPLIHSDRDAEQLAREMILAHEKWLPNFAATIEKLKS